MSHDLISNTWEAEARLIYRAISRTAKNCLKKLQQQKQEIKLKKPRNNLFYNIRNQKYTK